MPESPPIYLALDLWLAMGLEGQDFDAYYERYGWADTWATLLNAVRTKYGRETCGEGQDGDVCVLRGPHIGPHMTVDDVGTSEPLPGHGWGLSFHAQQEWTFRKVIRGRPRLRSTGLAVQQNPWMRFRIIGRED